MKDLQKYYISSKKEVDLKPTDAMAKAASNGLELRKKHKRGGTQTGVARARDIKNKKNLSPKTVKRMHSFFSRHSAFKEHHKDKTSAAWISWQLWGGNSGASWAARKIKALETKE